MTNEQAGDREVKVMRWTLDEEKETIARILGVDAGEPVAAEGQQTQRGAFESIQALLKLSESHAIACFHDFDPATNKLVLDMKSKAVVLSRKQIEKKLGTDFNTNVETFLATCTPTTDDIRKGKLHKILYTKDLIHFQEFKHQSSKAVPSINGGAVEKVAHVTPTYRQKTYNFSVYFSYISFLQEYQLRNVTPPEHRRISITRHYYNGELFYNIQDINAEFESLQVSSVDNKEDFTNEKKGHKDFITVKPGNEEGYFWKALETAWCDLHRLRNLDPLQEAVGDVSRMEDIASILKVNIFLVTACNKKEKKNTLVRYNFIPHDGESETLDRKTFYNKLGQNQQEYKNHLCLWGESDATTLDGIIPTEVRYYAMLKKTKIEYKVLQNNLSFYYSLIYALSGISIIRNYWVFRDPARNLVFYNLDDENNAALQDFKTLIGRERFDDEDELNVKAYIELLQTLVSKEAMEGVYISLHLEQTPITVFLLFGNSAYNISDKNPKSPLDMKYRIDLRMVYENGKCRFDFLNVHPNKNIKGIRVGGFNKIDRLTKFPAIATRVQLRPEASKGDEFKADSRRARMMGLLHIGPQVIGKNERTRTLYLQYIEGQDLHELVEEDKYTADISIKISKCIVNLVAMTVEVGIVHLDFKPSNIMVSTETEGKPFARILDWDINLVVGIHECTNDLKCDDAVFRAVAARLMLGQLISHLRYTYTDGNKTRNVLIDNLTSDREKIPAVEANSESYKQLCKPKEIPKEADSSVILNNSIILEKLKKRNINDKLEDIINYYFVKRNLAQLEVLKDEWLGKGITTSIDETYYLKRITENGKQQRLYMSKDLADACGDPPPFVSVVDEADATPIEVETEENLMEIAMENEKSDLDIRRRWNRDDDLPSRVNPECLPKSPRAKSTRAPP